MALVMPAFDRNDLGKGSFSQYKYGLTPNNSRVRLRLAGSNPHQDALRALRESGGELETAINRRNQQQDAADEPIEVRLFTGSSVTGPVGWVPRGLESIVDETLSRLDMAGQRTRIPVEIVRKGALLRVELLMGHTL